MTLPSYFPEGLGVEHGRIAPTRVSPPEGDWVLSLGAESPGRTSLFQWGDPPAMWELVAEKELSTALTIRWEVIGPRRMPVISDPGPFVLADGGTLLLRADRLDHTIVWDAADFAVVGAATAAEVAAVLNRDLPTNWEVSSTYGGVVRMEYAQYGRQSEIRVIGGTTAAAFGWRYPAWRIFLRMDDIDYFTRLVRPGDAVSLTDAFAALEDVPASSEYRVGIVLDVVRGTAGADTELIELELCSAYADDLVFSETEKSPAFARNRAPEPSEVHRVDEAIRFDLIHDGGGIPAGLDIYVTIGAESEVLVWSGGAAVPPWDVLSSSSTVSTNHERYTLWPPTELPSETTVTIRLVSGVMTIEEWSFVTEDITGPTVLEVSVPTKRSIRVRFDEPVDATAEDVSRYVVTAVDVPAVGTSVVAAVRDGEDSAVLTIDTSLSPGRLYTLTVSDVDDVSGNGSGIQILEFRAYVPPRTPENRVLDLLLSLPEWNRVDQDGAGDLARFIPVLQEMVDLILCEIDRFCDFVDPDLAPDEVLDLMLYDLGNPFQFSLDTELKRKLVRALVTIYKSKGTDPGMIDAILFFTGIAATIEALNDADSWLLGISELGEDTILGSDASQAYLFDVILDENPTDEEREIILDIIRIMRPVNMRLRNLIEPDPPLIIDHMELGLSELGLTWDLH